jgi:hypothetical protein
MFITNTRYLLQQCNFRDYKHHRVHFKGKKSQQSSTRMFVHILVLSIFGKINNFNFNFGNDKGARGRRNVFAGRHNKRRFGSTDSLMMSTIMRKTVTSKLLENIFRFKVLLLIFFSIL